MRTVEYVGKVLPDGHLEVPAKVRHELELLPNKDVKVILMCAELTSEEAAERTRKRHEAWQGIMELRESFRGMDFSLTDEIVRMREEEDV